MAHLPERKIRLNAEIHEAYVGDSGIEGWKGRHEVVVTIREVERKDDGWGSMEVRWEGGDEEVGDEREVGGEEWIILEFRFYYYYYFLNKIYFISYFKFKSQM